MEKETFSKLPIIYSLAYHSMSYSKDDPNQCAKQFMEHLKRTNCVLNKDTSGIINARMLSITDQKVRRELMMACNLELTVQSAEELFPHLLKSKEIRRDQIDHILHQVSANKQLDQ